MAVSLASSAICVSHKRVFSVTIVQNAFFRSSAIGRPAIFRLFAISGRTLGAELQQPLPGDHQIGQAEQRHQLRRVLGQAAITGLRQSKAVLDDVEGMLDLGADVGLDRFVLRINRSCCCALPPMLSFDGSCSDHP